MQAGRELDALVAEKVMEWKPIQVLEGTDASLTLYVEPGRRFTTWNASHPRPYSTDIAAAWAVVERMAELGFHCRIYTPFRPGEPHFAGLTPHDCTGWNGRPDHEASGETPAAAICLAALSACGATPNQEGE